MRALNTITAPNFIGDLNGVTYIVNATAPSSPTTNDVWFDTTALAVKRYNGTGWDTLGGSGGGTGVTTLAIDSFDRADSTTSIGSAQTGGTWVVQGGTWGISSNEAYCVSDASGQIVILPTVGTANFTVSCDMKGHLTSGTDYRLPNVVFRYIDSSNFIRCRFDNGAIVLGKYDAGVETVYANPSMTLLDNTYYNVRVKCEADNIKVWLNDVLKVDYTLSAPDQTKYGSSGVTGIRLSKGGVPASPARWNNFKVETNPTNAAVTSVAGRTGAVTLTSTDVGLANVTNESKATMFTSPTFTGTVSAATIQANTTVLAIRPQAGQTVQIQNSTGSQYGLKVQDGVATYTRNNTLDNGSGTMEVTGDLIARADVYLGYNFLEGTLTPTHQYLDNNGGATTVVTGQQIYWKRDIGRYVNEVLNSMDLGLMVFDGISLNTAMGVDYQNRTVAFAEPGWKLKTYYNTLDDGSGGSAFAGTITSTVPAGTAPFVLTSPTMVMNLNAQYLNGQPSSYYAPLASPTLTGTPTAPTPAVADNSTRIATTAWVKSLGYPATKSSANDVLVTTTSATTMSSFIPAAKGNFLINIYYRVVTGTTTVTITLTYTDGSGAQTKTLVNAVSTAVGSYTLAPTFINATAVAINVTATASVANNLYVSTGYLQL